MKTSYELIVIGTGPAGEKAAVKAAYFGHKVAIIEKESTYGGAEVATGTLPSKTLRETAIYLSGKHEEGLYGIGRTLEREVSIEDFMYRKNLIKQRASEEIEQNLIRHGVDIYHGEASFIDPHTIRVGDTLLQGDYILIATGSYPFHPVGIPFDGKRIHDSDTILTLTRFPRSLCVVGAGVIGCEYATIFATEGTKVILVNNNNLILPFIDSEISHELLRQMEEAGIQLLFNSSISALDVPQSEEEEITVSLNDGSKFQVDMFLFAAGRNGNTKSLACDKAGVLTATREAIPVDSTYRTNITHIYAVGDVIGFPALASTSMDQGRIAVAHMFHTKDLEHLPTYSPFGLYTIPEVSMIGVTEEEALKQKLAYVSGKARYSDMARGQIMGVKSGFLKLVFRKGDLVVLGVHVIGPMATELIHYGIMLVETKKTLYDIIGSIFNFPSLHELYKYAAYDALSTLCGKRVKP